VGGCGVRDVNSCVGLLRVAWGYDGVMMGL
jgi:hypothetical protein